MADLDSKKVLEDAAKIKKFISGSVEADFPGIQVHEVAKYDNVGGTMAAIIVTTDGRVYEVAIEEGQRPFVRRVVVTESKNKSS